MRVSIFSTAAEQIRAHARRDHPREACGLLLGRAGRIEAAVEAPNVAADPACTFEIDPAVLLRVHREARSGGRELLGWYHSHPNGRGEPSAADSARAVEDGKLWLIVAKGRVRAFRAVAAAGERFEEVELDVVSPIPSS